MINIITFPRVIIGVLYLPKDVKPQSVEATLGSDYNYTGIKLRTFILHNATFSVYFNLF